MATGARAQVGSWTVTHASAFAGPTTAGGSGTTTGGDDDGKWTDIQGGVASVNSSNQMALLGDNIDAYTFARDFVLRPAGEETQNQRLVSTIPSGIQSSNIWTPLRVQTNKDCYLTLAGSSGVLKIYKVVSGAGTALGTQGTFTYTAGHSYSFDSRAVSGAGGTSTTISITVTDLTTSTTYTTYSVADTTSEYQAGGRVGLLAPAQNASQVFTSATVYSDSGQNTAATAYTTTVSPSPATSGSPITLTYTPNGTTAAIVTPAQSGVSGSFSSSTVTLTGTTPVTDTFTPTSAGTASFTSTNTSGLTATSEPVTDVVSAGGTTYLLNDSHIYLSPYNWYLGPGGAYALSNNPGAYLKAAMTTTATGSVTMGVDVSALSSASVAANQYPTVRWSVDGGAYSSLLLTSTTTSLTLASSLAAGNHTLVLYFVSIGSAGGVDRWTTPVAALKLTGLTLVGSLTTPTLRPNRLIVYGDSITEGVNILDATGAASTGYDSTQTWGMALAQALNAEVGIVGFGGLGWQRTPGNNLPSFWNGGGTGTWNYLFAGHARAFAPTPDYCVVNLATNDIRNGVSAGVVQSAVFDNTAHTGFLTDFRAACPTTQVFILDPFGYQQDSSNLIAAVSNEKAYAGDTRVYEIEPGSEAATGLTGGGVSLYSYDGIHPNYQRSPQLGAVTAQLIQADLGGVATVIVNSFQPRRGR